MISKGITREEMWLRQQICRTDVNYDLWEERKRSLQMLARFIPGCIFTVDVYKQRYDFASGNFSSLFGYRPDQLKTIEKQGDLLEERIHPDDRRKMLEIQVQHARFIYSLLPGERNNYQNIYQFRMKNTAGRYINVISRQQVFLTDRNGKAWIIQGVMDIAPDQEPLEDVSYSCINRKTGEMCQGLFVEKEQTPLTAREHEILKLIRQGLLSKEIADRLHISIHTVHNHRKNILNKLEAGNIMEAIYYLSDSSRRK